MVFPATPLGVTAELQLAGTWTDITQFSLEEGSPLAAYAITRGRANETTSATPGTCALKLNNGDGRFTMRNPVGAYYPNLTRNTPLRVSVPDSGTYLRMEDDAVSSASTPDAAGLQITGSIDVRIDVNLSNWVPSVLCSKWSGTSKAWALWLNGDGSVTFAWFDGSVIHQASTAGVAVLPLGRSMIRATLNTATGTVQFFTAATMAGAQTLLATVTGAGATSVGAGAGTVVAVGDSAQVDASFGTQGCQGKVYEFRLYNGIAGTLKANPVFSAQTAGAASFADAQSNTWTMNGTAVLSARSYRFHGELSSLPQTWDVTGHEAWTPVTASGVLRRLQQGSAPLRSVMRRGIPAWPSIPSASMTSLSSLPSTIAYWPCEDNAGSTQIASGLAANSDGIIPPAMMVAGTASFQGTAGSVSADTVFACSAQLAQIGSSVWTGRVPHYSANGTAAMVTFLIAIPSGGLSGTPYLIQLNFTSGSRLLLSYSNTAGGTLALNSYNGIVFLSVGSVTGVNGLGFMIQIGNVSTGTATAFLNTLQAGLGQTEAQASSSLAATSGQLTSVVVNPFAANCGATELGHIWVEAAFSSAGTQDALPGLNAAGVQGLLNAHAGESAGTRFARLCAENGTAARVYGYPLVTAAMGAQPIDTLANQLQFCEDADRGQIFDPRTCLGLGYRTLASLCNQAAAVTLSVAADEVAPPLLPVDDDAFIRNDVTVTRSGGSAAQVQVTSGPLSVNAPPAGAGDYPSSLTVYAAFDAQLPGIASWMAHVGTADQERFPSVAVDLASTDAAVQGILAAVRDADIGANLAVTGATWAWLPPGTIQQLIWGSAEQLGDFAWPITWNTVPEQPYETGVYGTMHYDTAGSALHSGVTSSAVTLSVDVTAGNLWTTSAGDFPFNIMIAGELIKVTNITGGSSPQSFTVVRSQNGVVKAQSAAAAVNVWVPPVYALAGAA